MRKCISQNELKFYIDSLKDYYDFNSSDYTLIIEKLAKEFEIECSKEELDQLFNPSIEEEDIKLQINNLGIQY